MADIKIACRFTLKKIKHLTWRKPDQTCSISAMAGSRCLSLASAVAFQFHESGAKIPVGCTHRVTHVRTFTNTCRPTWDQSNWWKRFAGNLSCHTLTMQMEQKTCGKNSSAVCKLPIKIFPHKKPRKVQCEISKTGQTCLEYSKSDWLFNCSTNNNRPAPPAQQTTKPQGKKTPFFQRNRKEFAVNKRAHVLQFSPANSVLHWPKTNKVGQQEGRCPVLIDSQMFPNATQVDRKGSTGVYSEQIGWQEELIRGRKRSDARKPSVWKDTMSIHQQVFFTSEKRRAFVLSDGGWTSERKVGRPSGNASPVKTIAGPNRNVFDEREKTFLPPFILFWW